MGMSFRNTAASIVQLLWVALLNVALASAVSAAESRLIKDVNSLPMDRDSLCGQPVVVNGVAFFCAANYQLWQSDGSEAGTKPVRQENGQIVSDAYDLVASGGWLYFTRSYELWRTDGTPQNTLRLSDAEGRAFDAELMTDVDGELYFFDFNREGAFLHELWKTNGTNSGSVRVKRFDPRLDPNDAAAVNGELYFTNYEHELWKSDGTEAGTVLLKDMTGRNYNQDHNNLTNVGGVLFFSLENDVSSYDLWKSDGTTAGTVLIKPNVTGQYMQSARYRDVDGQLFFTAESNYTDTVIWRSDGTAAGTQPVVTMPGGGNHATVFRDLYIFDQGNALWRTDGTAAGTFQLAVDLVRIYGSAPAVHQGRLYFGADNASGLGYELWATNGWAGGTELVSNIAWQDRSSSPHFFASVDSGLIFQADKGRSFGGPALWVSDGTDSGTEQVQDISDFSYGAYPSASVLVGDQVYFLANMTRVPTTNQQWQVWKTDGSEAGTVLVLDLIEEVTGSWSNSYGGEYAELAGLNGLLYVSGRDNINSNAWGMWRTDGTPSGAEQLTDVVPSTQNQPFRGLTVFDDRLFFFAETNDGDGLRRLANSQTSSDLLVKGLVDPASMTALQERLVFVSDTDDLWQSDGTAGGTVLVKSLGLADDAVIDGVQAFGEKFVFRARWNFDYYGNAYNSALWVSDGTASGTYALVEPHPVDLVVTDRGLYYSDYNRLWYSDGTIAGATLLLERWEILHLTAVADTVYFSVDEQSLWKTRGTAATTMQVAGGLSITGMLELNDTLFFAAFDAAPGGGYFTNTGGLRTSDGSPSGTVMVLPGIDYLEELQAPGGNLFLGLEAGLPWQIWKTDGTVDGTLQLSNFQSYSNFGPFYYEPQTELYLTDTMIFSVDDGTHGPELWALELAEGGAGSGMIGDFTWWDQDANGVQDGDEPGLADVYVSLQDCNGTALASTRSGINGYYSFENLAAGDYQLVFDLPDGYTFSPAKAVGDYKVDSNPDPATGLVECRSLAAGQNRRALDAGFIRDDGGRMGDRVWFDIDADGVQDSDEPGAAGVTVSLEDCAGSPLQTTYTDTEGKYLFTALAPGEYRVRFGLLPGYIFSPAKTSGDYRTDSNADGLTGLTSCRTLAAGQNRLSLDAGLVPMP